VVLPVYNLCPILLSCASRRIKKMAVKCKHCSELKGVNNTLIRNQYFLIRDFRKFVKDSIKSDADILEQLERASGSLDCLLQDLKR